MGCQLVLKGSAERFLRAAPAEVKDKINGRLAELADRPECERRLRGFREGLCRARVGDW